MEKVRSYPELIEKTQQLDNSYLLFYKSGSEQSICAYNNIELITQNTGNRIFFVDVLETKDVHPYFNVSSVPTLVELKSANAGRQLKGCHDKKILESFINHSMYNAKSTDEPKPVKKVTVYSTTTCPHCTTLKNYLKDHKINFTDIDLSKNSKAAEDLVRRSGQQGVPQTDINGKIIVGFDKKKIDEMLEIK